MKKSYEKGSTKCHLGPRWVEDMLVVIFGCVEIVVVVELVMVMVMVMVMVVEVEV